MVDGIKVGHLGSIKLLRVGLALPVLVENVILWL
jgi:hypothetical protein